MFSVDKHNSKWVPLGKCLGGLREIRRSDKHTLTCFRRAKASAKSPDLGLADAVLQGVSLGLNIDSVEPQGILVNNAVDAAITRPSDNLSSVLPRTAISHREKK